MRVIVYLNNDDPNDYVAVPADTVCWEASSDTSMSVLGIYREDKLVARFALDKVVGYELKE